MLLWQLKLYLSPQTVEVPIRKLLTWSTMLFLSPLLSPPSPSTQCSAVALVRALHL